MVQPGIPFLYEGLNNYLCICYKNVDRVCENNKQRNMLRLKRVGITRGLRKVRNKELRNIYSPPDIAMTMKLREMKWVQCATCVETMRNAYKILIFITTNGNFRGPSADRQYRKILNECREGM